MTPGQPETDAHLSEHDIAQLHDQELSDDVQARLEQHIAQCTVCRAGVERFGEQSRTVTRVLELADEPLTRLVRRPVSPGSRRMHTRSYPALKRAAIVLLVLGTGLFATRTTRAWVIERWQDLRAMLGREPTPAPSAPEVTPPIETAPSNVVSLTFASSSDSLFVQVMTRQEEGQVTISRTDRSDILIEIDGGGDETVGVVPSGLTIHNTSNSVASYRISIPRGMRVVLVGIGNEQPRRVDWQNGSVYTVQLAPQ